MVNNIFRNVKVPVNRVDVNFYLDDIGALEAFMGKKIHMQFIQNPKFLRMFTHRYMDLFTN